MIKLRHSNVVKMLRLMYYLKLALLSDSVDVFNNV